MLTTQEKHCGRDSKEDKECEAIRSNVNNKRLFVPDYEKHGEDQ